MASALRLRAEQRKVSESMSPDNQKRELTRATKGRPIGYGAASHAERVQSDQLQPRTPLRPRPKLFFAVAATIALCPVLANACFVTIPDLIVPTETSADASASDRYAPDGQAPDVITSDGDDASLQPDGSAPNPGETGSCVVNQTCAQAGGMVCPYGTGCLRALVSALDTPLCCLQADCMALDRRLTEAVRTTRAIVLDGNLDDWSNIRRVPITGKPIGAPEPDDLQATFSLQWDDRALYGLVEVTDNVIFEPHSPPEKRYTDDVVECFIDVVPRNPKREWDKDESHFYFPQTNQVIIDNPNPGDWSAKSFFSTDREHRYWVEFEVVWPGPFPKPTAGSIIGLDIAVDDNDGTVGQRKNQLMWNDETGRVFEDARLFGLVRLVPIPECAPVTDRLIPTVFPSAK